MERDRMERFVWTGEDGNIPIVITNDMLQCSDCVYRMEPQVIECEIYEEKPGYVLNQAKPCKRYEKKTD